MRKLILTLFIAFAMSASAQKTTPDFTYDVGGKIQFMQLTDAGVLVVAGSGGLVGILPGADKPHFIFKEYGKVKEEELELVPMSPYAVITQGGKSQIPGTIFANSKRTVIDIISGKIMFATEENGWKQIAQLKIFLPQNKLVVVGNRTKKEDERLAVGIYDLATGNQDGFAILDNFKGKVRSAAAIPMSSGAPFLSGDRVFVPTTKNVVCADIKNGEILWEAKVDKLTWMLADESGKEIYGFEERNNGDTRIHKFSGDGLLLWDKERKIKGKVTRFQILPQGLAVVSDVFKNTNSSAVLTRLTAGTSESKIGFLSAATGEDLWDKAPKTKGFVQHFFIMDDGILFGLHSGGINKISFDGQPLFKKPLSTGENIHTMANTPKGLIYITDSDAGIVDLRTGDPVWKKPIKYPKAKAVSSAYDQSRQRYLISTGSEILAIDENTADVSTLAKFSLKEKEDATEVAVRDAGLLLTSNQNLLMLNFDGGESFHEYYKSPGQSTFVKIAMGVVTVAAAATAAAAASQSTHHYELGNYSSAGAQRANNNARAAQAFSDIASASFNEMVKRFSATAATENAQFILTTLDGGVGLVKVNKDSGKLEREIVLKDKKPEYKVDDLGGYLYYISGNSEIAAYRL